ncbi:la-related protein 6A-like [Phalaenopsis equestris]|uniref:la-related protein 6A-like n=1 Tax=Phalaenopsis equestris TaxID=78828 RepID=UPI0009E3B6F1|nr:la-related protein 6A-like [Phalaenopsis equestris]
MAILEPAPSPPPPPAAGGSPASNDSRDPIASDSPLDDTETQDRLEDCEPVHAGSRHVTEDNSRSSCAASLHHALFDKIVRQVEYYFSDENLPNDVFLLKHVRKDKEGSRSPRIFLFLPLIEGALRTSSLLVVSSDGKRVKRLHPLPIAKLVDEKARTVLVENLPEDYSEDRIREIFAIAGRILGVTIHKPQQIATLKTAHFAISSKLHALVVYDTVEAAESAVSSLNDEMNWRNGMRVQILLKRMEKYGLAQKTRKNVFLVKNNGAEALEIPALNQNGLDKEEDDNCNESMGGRRNRCRGRGGGNHQQPTNGQGHRNVPAGFDAEGMISKPFTGPKMPDGTRGFTMGRGRPIST